MSDWKPLPYFREACREAFGPYLLQKNLRETTVSSPLGIAFSDGRLSLYFDYRLEDIPNYQLQIGVGVSGAEPLTRDAHLGFWALIPEGDVESHYWNWTWGDEAQLEKAAKRIVDDVFPTYLNPVLEDPSAIQKALLRRGKQAQAERDAKATSMKRKNAEQAFKRNDFAEVVRIYEDVPEIDLTAVDNQRLKIALTKI